jgi:DNA-binding NarL/FixJ family response regulator
VQQARFLVVDDEPIANRSITRVLAKFGEVACAASVADAFEFMRERREWCGLVLDLRLPDGSGLDVLERAREQGPHTPALLLSGEMEPDAINRAFALDAKCLCKPCPTEHLRQFAQEALLAESEIPERMVKAVRDLATKHGLTPAQVEILQSVVRGIDRASIVASRQVSENTHKTQVRSILRKTRTLSLGELRDQVLRSVAGAA